MSKKTLPDISHRAAVVEKVDKDNRTITFSLSSETPARQWYGTEVLEHSERAIDLSAARNNSFPVMYDHGNDPTVGTRPHGRAENFRLDPDKRTRAELRMRNTDIGDMVLDGTLDQVSIGYEVLDYEERGEDEVYVTSWRPREVSITPVGKDFTVGANRSMERKMDEHVKQPVDEAALIEKGRKAELARRSEIKRLSALNPDEALMTRALDEGWKPEQYTDAMLELQQRAPKTVAPVSVQPGKEIDHSAGLRDALEYRTALYEYSAAHRQLPERKELQKRMEGNEYRGLTIPDIARLQLEEQGYSMRGISNRDAVMFAMGHPGAPVLQQRAVDMPHNVLTTTLPALLEDLINKAIRLGWELADETWNMWTQTSSAADFKTGSRVHTSNLSRLAVTAENDEYPLTAPSDFKEPFTVQKYGRRISISIEALTNDDLGDLTRIPTKLGRAGSATVGDSVYNVLTANANMSDGNPLFDATNHGGNDSGVGGMTAALPTLASISEMRVMMGRQTDNQSATPPESGPNTLNIKLKYIVTPLTQEDAARVVVESITNPQDNQAAGIINPQFSRNFIVVADPRLDANSTTQWYGAGTMDTVEVVWLNGQNTPMVDSQPNFSRDGIVYRGRIFYDVLPTDWRALGRNAGA